MPSLEMIFVGFGALMLLIGVLGGGIEVKEIKCPHISGLARFGAVVSGIVFVLLGLGYKADPPGTATPPDQTAKVVPATPVVKRDDPEVVDSARARREDTARLQTAEERGRVLQQLSAVSWRLDWNVGRDPYIARLELDGRVGKLRVAYSDANGRRHLVDQRIDVVFEQDDTIALRGSNPVHANTARPHDTYAPDTFRLKAVSDGQSNQINVSMCDANNICALVEMKPWNGNG